VDQQHNYDDFPAFWLDTDIGNVGVYSLEECREWIERLTPVIEELEESYGEACEWERDRREALELLEEEVDLAEKEVDAASREADGAFDELDAANRKLGELQIRAQHLEDSPKGSVN